MIILNEILKILIFFYVSNFLVQSKTVNITVTTNGINTTIFQNLVSMFQTSNSKCPNNYTIKVIPYNLTVPFVSPLNQNDFSAIQLVFGPSQYFSPSYFGFGLNTPFSFSNAYISDSFMNYTTRLNLMLTAANAAVANDVNKTVVFVLNGSNVDPAQPWKSFNPMPYLSSFVGSINIQKYYNPGDGVSVCSGILSSRTVTIVMDLSRSGAIDVLTACNDRNLLNWRLRWLIFFSSLSYVNASTYKNFSLRSNVTIYDFSHTNEFSSSSPQNITEEQDVVLSDIAYTVVKLMDYSECKISPANILNLRTGNFSFNNGVVRRINWNLDVYKPSGIVGSVTITNGVVAINQPSLPLFNSSTQNIVNEMQAKPFRVAAMLEKPFAYYDTDNVTKIGYSVDMIIKILTNLNVTYNITFYNYSSGILSNNVLNGMLGIAQNGQADIIIGAVTQNLLYRTYVDFTNPFMVDTVGILYRINATNLYSEIFEFINAFHWSIWALIVTSCVTYAVALTVVNLISPNQAKFSFRFSFLLTMGSMVQGVTTALPDKISGRILIVFWWIFNIAVLLAYVANYGAILTNNRMQSSIKQLSDLFLQNTYAYGTVKNSSIDYFLQTSTSADIQNVNQVIRSQYANMLPASTDAALFLVANTTYAFIYGNQILYQYINISCYSLVSGTDQFNYSYALPLNSDYTNIINTQISSLDSVFLKNLKNKYFPSFNIPDCHPSNWLELVLDTLGYSFISSPSYSLNINKTAGIFVVMIIGIILAIIIGIIELIVRKCRKPRPS